MAIKLTKVNTNYVLEETTGETTNIKAITKNEITEILVEKLKAQINSVEAINQEHTVIITITPTIG
ncbi:MAG: hypothetical protein EKK61_03890 [Rickettsiales bacterium]|nr:MAG: hypothetical protein EKK61_03890 [Rickettsiales bacterium]